MTERSPHTETPLLVEGKTCWRKVRAERVALLVDGETYFRALAEAASRARHRLYIIGWDFDDRIRLVRDGEFEDWPLQLCAFLQALARRREELEIYVLDWDFAMIYALERQPLPIFRLGLGGHPRLHFELDGNHPLGASHHQKIVVVDDRVAFAGGFDLARCRWDTCEHLPNDERREDAEETYGPFHDLQLLVDGEAARALGDLARRRWLLATGDELAPPPDDGHDPWPESCTPDLEEVELGISRTEPAYDGDPEVREIEEVYRRALTGARELVYIENQYLTSKVVGDLLRASLERDAGPEIILVLPRVCSGWLEESTMGLLRAHLLEQLRQADRHGRLQVFYPTGKGLEEQPINVHGKLLIVDDRLLMVGSANLSNRSMGFDTECNLVVEAGEDQRVGDGIAALRGRLLAEHCGMAQSDLEARIAAGDSVGRVLEGLEKSGRWLEQLENSADPTLRELAAEAELIDPERPMQAERLLDQFGAADNGAATEDRGKGRGLVRPQILLAGVVVLLLVLWAVWRWTPLGEEFDYVHLLVWGREFRDSAWGPVVVLGAYLLGSLVMFPITVLIAVTVAVFGAIWGFGYALVGSMAAAMLAFGLGHVFGRATIRRFGGRRLNRLSRQMGRRGLLAMFLVHMVPVAPFTLVNLVAGASHIRARDFFLGTLLGMGPGIGGIAALGAGIEKLLRDPGVATVAGLVLIVAVTGGGLWLLKRWAKKQADRGRTGS